MSIFDKLQRVSIQNEYGDITYADVKRNVVRHFSEFYRNGGTATQSVYSTYYYMYEHHMNQNGMRKLIAMVLGMLFMIEHNDVEPDQAYSTMLDIRDFETGEYDDLFDEEDLRLLKADIQIVKDYVAKHPELLE